MRTLTPYWTTRSLASDLFEEMDRLFDGWNQVAPARGASQAQVGAPAFTVTEADEHYLMSIDLPGMKKEDIKIEVLDNVLTISGERKREPTEQNVRAFGKFYGSFQRRFNLPESVEVEKVEARYEDGVLELYLPKAPTTQPRLIEVRDGKGGFFEKLLGARKNHQETVGASSNKN